MASHALFKKYRSLNAHYTGTRPSLGSDVKCVQCDGCDRVITFVVFHSEYAGGVDVCNVCRVAVERSRNGYVMRADRKRRLCFTEHPLCFVGVAPLPERFEMDKDEVDVEKNPRVLARRFAKSVRVVADCGGASRPRQATRGVRSDKSDGGEGKRGRESGREEGRDKRPRRGGDTTTGTVECTDGSAGTSTRPSAATPPSAESGEGADLAISAEATAVAAPVDGVQEEGVTTNLDHSQSPAVDEQSCAWRGKLERIADSPVAKYFLGMGTNTKNIVERPLSVVRQPLCVLDHDNNREFTVAPNTSCRFSRGFVGFTSCSRILCVRIVPTAPDVGLWISVMCEEECCVRLEMWHCSLDVSVPSTPTTSSLNSVDEAHPQRKYCVHMGRYVAESLDWLPIPLHRTDNNILGLCTFVRGRHLISTLLPRDVTAAHSLPSAATGGDGDGDGDGSGCICLAAEVCGATLLKYELQPVETRWSSNGTSIAETFLFVIGRCTSVVVLQPIDDTRSDRLTLRVVHYVAAKGVTAPLSFLPSPPLVVGAARSGHTMLVMTHGTSVACYQAPDFSTKLFVAMEDVVCSVRFHKSRVVAGLLNGAVVDINTGERMARLESPPLLIGDVTETPSDGETWFLADASGRCTRIHQSPVRRESVKTCDFLLCRGPRGPEQRATLMVGSGEMSASVRVASDGVPRFVQHPLQHLMGVGGPLLAVFSDGAWALLLQREW